LQLLTCFLAHNENEEIIGGKLVYILRDNMKMVKFYVNIGEKGNKHRATINGIVYKRFFIEEIY
jgi:hypothetical protein